MTGFLKSQLYDELNFYQKFFQDLERCKKEVIVESPYITCERMRTFDRIFIKLLQEGVKIYIITRDPKEHYQGMEVQSEAEIRSCENLGIHILLCLGNHHRKLAIIDRKILWEGSLNILSQTYSREIMRRIEDEELTMEMFDFLKLNQFL